MLINNYGLFWRRDQVLWEGKRGRPGHLKGRRTKRGAIVDFRDQQGVYALYDDAFNLVYVGQAGKKKYRLFKRLKDHLGDHLSARWSLFSWFGIRSVNQSGRLKKTKPSVGTNLVSALDHIEAVMITINKPPMNLQGGRFGKEVHAYFQYSDPDLPLDTSSMVKVIYDADYKD